MIDLIIAALGAILGAAWTVIVLRYLRKPCARCALLDKSPRQLGSDDKTPVRRQAVPDKAYPRTTVNMRAPVLDDEEDG